VNILGFTVLALVIIVSGSLTLRKNGVNGPLTILIAALVVGFTLGFLVNEASGLPFIGEPDSTGFIGKTVVPYVGLGIARELNRDDPFVRAVVFGVEYSLPSKTLRSLSIAVENRWWKDERNDIVFWVRAKY
jgi:hypothetical protein